MLSAILILLAHALGIAIGCLNWMKIHIAKQERVFGCICLIWKGFLDPIATGTFQK